MRRCYIMNISRLHITFSEAQVTKAKYSAYFVSKCLSHTHMHANFNWFFWVKKDYHVQPLMIYSLASIPHIPPLCCSDVISLLMSPLPQLGPLTNLKEWCCRYTSLFCGLPAEISLYLNRVLNSHVFLTD